MWFKDWINEKEKRPKKLGDLVKKEKRKRRIKDKLSWEGSSNAMPPYHESPRQPLRVNTQYIETRTIMCPQIGIQVLQPQGMLWMFLETIYISLFFN